MSVAKLWDDLWQVVKCLSSLRIAGSPRNSFRTSVRRTFPEVELLDGISKGLPGYSNQTPNAGKNLTNSKTMGAKLRSQKGNSPDRHLRSLNFLFFKNKPCFF